jgi:hypothetical protein
MHIIYIDCDGHLQETERDFTSIAAAEAWLESIGATEWQIGF